MHHRKPWLPVVLVALVGGLLAFGAWAALPSSSSLSQETSAGQEVPTETEVPPNEWVEPVPTYHFDEEELPTPYTIDPQEPFIFISEDTYGDTEDAAFRHAVARIELFIIGRVVEVLPAQWTTPDGRRPEDPWTVDHVKVTIVTPVVIEIDEAVAVREGAWDGESTIVVAIFGGVVGEDMTRTNLLSERLSLDERVLLGLSNYTYLDKIHEYNYPTLLGSSMSIELKWQIIDDMHAVFAHPDAQPEPLDEVIAYILDLFKEVPALTP